MAIAFLIGRILFGGYFFLTGIDHVFKSGNLVGYAASKGLPVPKVAVIGSGILALLGGLSLLTGYMPFDGIILLLIFMIPVTLKMHDFWKQTEPAQRMHETIAFKKNVAIIAALLMFLIIPLPWVYSVAF